MTVPTGMGYAGIVAIPIPPDGATGTVLTKATATDYDMAWAAGGGGGPVADGDYVDITVSGVGLIWTIDPGVVTYAKMQNISGPSLLLGRGDSGAGSPQEISLGTNLAIAGTVLNAVGAGASVDGSWRFSTSTVAADPGNRNFRLDNATLASVTAIYINDTTVNGFDASTILGFLRAGNRIYIQQKNDATRAALFLVTGTATDNTGWWTVPVTTILDGGVLYQNNAECGFILLLSAGVVTDADYGDITVTGAGTIWTIDPTVVTNAKLANVATQTFKGRTTAGAGSPEDLTVAQAKTLLNLAGTNTGDQTITLTTDVTGSGTGSFAATIALQAVTYPKMQNVSAISRLLGRGSAAGVGSPEEIILGTNLTMVGTTLNASGGGGGATATTVEVSLGSTPVYEGKFTITDAAIGTTSKVIVLQAPGPYTGKGVRADEAAMDQLECVAEPLAGSARVSWRLMGGRRPANGPIFGEQLGSQSLPLGQMLEFNNTMLGRVKGNFKFTYMVYA